jgi:hypothetical protein
MQYSLQANTPIRTRKYPSITRMRSIHAIATPELTYGSATAVMAVAFAKLTDRAWIRKAYRPSEAHHVT